MALLPLLTAGVGSMPVWACAANACGTLCPLQLHAACLDLMHTLRYSRYMPHIPATAHALQTLSCFPKNDRPEYHTYMRTQSHAHTRARARPADFFMLPPKSDRDEYQSMLAEAYLVVLLQTVVSLVRPC